MTVLTSLFGCLLAAIALHGVEGEGLVTRAFLDVNNARVGDPLILTVDFLGEADFAALHPPALSDSVDKKFWRIDDKSAKTETVDNARRLVYRVRPLREGCYDFPALAFAYTDKSSSHTNIIETQKLPVHIIAGSQAALAALNEETTGVAHPDGLFVNLAASPWHSGAALSEDDLFAWKRACAQPSEEAFSAFDFPEARLNAAACALLAGHWAKAQSIYETLEWRIGEIPAITRGLRTARALATNDPAAELPAWRLVLHPILQYDWRGRAACVVCGIAALVLILYLLSRLARSVFCLVFFLAFGVLFPARADPAASLFEEFERMSQEMLNSSSKRFFGERSMFGVSKPDLSATIAPDREEVRVGEPFSFIINVTAPKDVTLSGLNLSVSGLEALVGLGRGEPMTDLAAADTNCVVRRIAIPVRCDAPFKGKVSFVVRGRYEQQIRRPGQSIHTSSSFSLPIKPIRFEVAPLPLKDQPPNFTGIVATKLSIIPHAGDTQVATNDVVALDIEVNYAGYIPLNAFPDVQLDDRRQRLIYRTYFRAEGAKRTPQITIPYYDIEKKAYCTASAPGIALQYRLPSTNVAPERVAINLGEEAQTKLKLATAHFAPRSSAKVLGTLSLKDCHKTEEVGEWVRLDDGHHAGWILKKEWEQAHD